MMKLVCLNRIKFMTMATVTIHKRIWIYYNKFYFTESLDFR